LGFEIKKITKTEVELDTQKGFTEVDKDGKMDIRIWIQMIKFELT